MKREYWLIACGWTLLPGRARTIEPVPASPLAVDLQNVVEIGAVQPVNGITSAG